VQEDAGHPGLQGGGHEKNNQEKWRVEEEEIPQKINKLHQGFNSE
jgi:hypothetical protein